MTVAMPRAIRVRGLALAGARLLATAAAPLAARARVLRIRHGRPSTRMVLRRCHARGLALVGLLLLSTCAVATGGGDRPALAASAPPFVPGRVLVGVDETMSELHVRQLAPLVGATYAGTLAPGVHRLQVPAGKEQETIQSLKVRQHIRYAEPDYLRSPTVSAPNDPQFTNQTNLTPVAALDGWRVYPNCYSNCQGAGANHPVVAIIDTGMDGTNPDLATQVLSPSYYCLPSDDHCTAYDPALPAMDRFGHGTHVAGIVAASANDGKGVAGLAYNARLLNLQTGRRGDGDSSTSGVASALYLAASLRVAAVNLSLGSTDYSITECDAVRAAADAGVVVVAAAGNDARNELYFPSNCQGAVRITATDDADAFASFSDWGPGVFVAAPGANVLSTMSTDSSLPQNNPAGFGRMSGTSMAAPHVSGLVALLKGLNPGLTSAQVRTLIAQNADKVGPFGYGPDPAGLCNCTWNDHYGYGRINLQRTLRSALAEAHIQPHVDGVSPSSGPVAGGTQLTITGQSFYDVQAVTFASGTNRTDRVATSFTATSDTQIVVTTPADDAGTYQIRVSTPGGTSDWSAAAQYAVGPVVTSISPSHGPFSEDTPVTISGLGFSDQLFGTRVFFGTAEVDSRLVHCSSTVCNVSSPVASVPGTTVDVTVLVNGVHSNPVSYTYDGPSITSVTPAVGSETGGDLVSIVGAGLASVNGQQPTILFAPVDGRPAAEASGVNCTVGRACTVYSPPGRGTVDIIASVKGIRSAASAADRFTYKPWPKVTGISPTVGPATGGTRVTISGANFSPVPGATRVTFGAVPATGISCASATTCSATSPAGVGQVDVTVTVDNATSTTDVVDRFTYAPVITGISPASGPANGGTVVTISGAGFMRGFISAGDVVFGNVSATSGTCTETMCTITAPAGEGTVDARVTATPFGLTSAISPADRFTYQPVGNEPGWTRRLLGGSAPDGADRGASTFDVARNAVVFVGLNLDADGTPVMETWTWDTSPNGWRMQTPAVSPTPRIGASLVYDAAHRQVLLFGGRAGDVRNKGALLNDAWLWDGTTWSQATPASSPPARRSTSLAYDAARQQVVLFGGLTGAGDIDDTWTWSGSAWTPHPLTTRPAARLLSSLAYDPVHQQVVLFAGSTAAGAVADTWTWDGTSWTQRSPLTSPPARDSGGLAFDASRSAVLLFGGISVPGLQPSELADTWLWDGSNWSQQSASNPPPAQAPLGLSSYQDGIVFVATDSYPRNTIWTWR